MNAIVLAGLLGGIGGLTRGVVGLLKALSLRRRILWGYYLITVVISVIVGVFIGIIFSFDTRVSLLAGYAGTDIIEGIYKSFAVQKVYIGTGNAKLAMAEPYVAKRSKDKKVKSKK
jgi:hypothetical protein